MHNPNEPLLEFFLRTKIAPKAGQVVICPTCKQKVDIVLRGQWGPFALGHHETKEHLSDNLYVKVECRMSGLEIHDEDAEKEQADARSS